jgi:hypothetical protein
MATLTRPQAAFLQLPHKFRAYVGGFGSGKTWVGSTGICEGFWQHPRINQGYFAPSYPQIRDIFYPTIEEVAAEMGLRIQINQGNKEVHFYEGKKYRGTTICRSMDKPETIVGFKIGNALIDELDVMKPEKAQIAWRKIIARMRYKRDGLRNGIDVATTPEGFRFVYQQFYKEPLEKPELQQLYGLIQASTYENARFLPKDYISSLMASYPAQLIAAYLEGKFVNLTAGAVYPDFDRVKNHTPEMIEPGEELHLGLDFNVYNCTAAVGVIRFGAPKILGELVKMRDTPHVIETIKEKYPDHRIHIYPDASGNSNKTVNATESDIALLKRANFTVHVPNKNPFVKERVMAVNGLVCNSVGERKLLINTIAAPTITECLEQQVYDDNGEPDKTTGKDHAPDALGYFIHYRWPIVKPNSSQRIQLPHMAR